MPDSRADENNGFGPLYKPRSCLPMYVSAVFILFLYVAIIFFFDSKNGSLKSFEDYVFSFGFSLLAVLIGELLRRACLFPEEYRHLDARYEGSLKKAVLEVFGFENNALVCVLAAIAFIIAAVFLRINDWESFNHDQTRLFFLNAIFMPIFVHVVRINNPPKVEYSQNNEQESKNLADGLAWSYYFGYLEFDLPALPEKIEEYNQTGIEKHHRTEIEEHQKKIEEHQKKIEEHQKKIEEHHQTDIEEHHQKIDVKKLFILLPKNCLVLDEISSSVIDPQNLIEDVRNLKPLVRNRGGIRDREYKHTVYRILEKRPGGEEMEHFCVMEYATPLETLFDMSKHSTPGLSREEKDQQVVLFYNKLKHILDEDPQCKGNYELIPFSGETDLAEIMINALRNPPLEIRE